MFDNFVQEKYHSYDQVFKHPVSGHFIYIGDAQSAMDMDFLQQHNIQTVVTAARDMDHVKYQSTILHVVYPLIDGNKEDIASFFDNFFQLVEKNISRGSILVHCAAGISRSSTLVISYLMKLQNLSFKQAIAQVRQNRPSVLPNLGFERQLKRYQQAMRGRESHRRGESKTAQSSGHQLPIKTQLLPNFQFDKPKSSKNKGSKLGQLGHPKSKQIQMLRIYNSKEQDCESRLGNTSKHKNFVITKKGASFSRQPQSKVLMMAALRSKQPKQFLHPAPKYQKHLTSLQEMKALYLTKKGIVERRNTNTTERLVTFYNKKEDKLEV